MKILVDSNDKVLIKNDIALGIKTEYEWNQCPEAVRNFISQVNYNPSDYTTSQIANYAPVTAVSTNTKPEGKTIDGTTFYNEVPNIKTPFATSEKFGTLMPLDQLRWINTAQTQNVRDLGGWSVDNGAGKIKYGTLIRGGATKEIDADLMVNKIGVKTELQLYGGSDSDYTYSNYSLWGIDWYGANGYIWYSIAPSKWDLWKYDLRVIFDSVLHHKPVYFHCGAGRDRTGTVAVMLEAILGMSQSDIDKDFELTSFATGAGSGIASRAKASYKDYISDIKDFPLVSGLTDSFRNRAISFVLNLGFSVAEINAFRTACIDGTVEQIAPTLNTYTITKSGANIEFDNNISSISQYEKYEVNVKSADGYVMQNISVTMNGVPIDVFTGTEVVLSTSITNLLTYCTTDNNATSAIKGQGYVANITPNTGYTLEGAQISITMGGTEVSTQYYSNGKIAIPNVTGNVIISITAVQQGYDNLAILTEWMFNERIKSSGEIVEESRTQVTNPIPVAEGQVFRIRTPLYDLEDYPDTLPPLALGVFTDASEEDGELLVIGNDYIRTNENEHTNKYEIKKLPALPTGVSQWYIRFTLPYDFSLQSKNIDGIIITKNQPILSSANSEE